MATLRRPPYAFPTSRSFYRPPSPPPAPAVDPTRSALVALVLLLGGTLVLAVLAPPALVPLEFHLFGRLIRLRMSALSSWLFGSRAKTAAGVGSGSTDDDRQRRLALIEHYGALLPCPDGLSAGTAGSHAGIVNMSGTFCFLNAILQVLASSPRFLTHSHAILALSASLATTSPSTMPAVTASLLPFLLTLATPSDSRHPRPLRPTDLVEALRSSEAFKKAGMFGRLREQQDAHELWALLAGAVDDEAVAVGRLADRDGAGLRSLLPSLPTPLTLASLESTGAQLSIALPSLPWSGRMAYRRACVVCGYSEGIRLMRTGEVSLSLPERTSMTTLERLLGQVTALEELVDAQCRKCRITRTHATLRAALIADDLDELPIGTGNSSASTVKRKGRGTSADPAMKDPGANAISSRGGAFAALAEPSFLATTAVRNNGDGSSQTKARRRRERAGRRNLEQRRARLAEIERLMAEGRWEDDVEGVQWALVEGGLSTRQEMFSAPPDLLVIHLNRSSFSSYSASKNTCRVAFPGWLDLSPFCTMGELGTDPAKPISRRATEGGTLGALAEGAAGAGKRETYTLVGFVNHLGGHSSGHYITYRLIPFSKPERWLRISDDDVVELPPGGGDEIWRWSGRGEVVLLFYERTTRAEDAADKQEASVVTAAAGGAKRTGIVTGPLNPLEDASVVTNLAETSIGAKLAAKDDGFSTAPAIVLQNRAFALAASPTPPPPSVSPSSPTSPSPKTPPQEPAAADIELNDADVVVADPSKKTSGKQRKKKRK